jgi:hypothetical protein
MRSFFTGGALLRKFFGAVFAEGGYSSELLTKNIERGLDEQRTEGHGLGTFGILREIRPQRSHILQPLRTAASRIFCAEYNLIHDNRDRSATSDAVRSIRFRNNPI